MPEYGTIITEKLQAMVKNGKVIKQRKDLERGMDADAEPEPQPREITLARPSTLPGGQT